MNHSRKLISLFLFIIVFSGCSGTIHYFVNAHRDASADVLVIPNDYRLFLGNEEIHFVKRKRKQDNAPVVIHSDILEIGWDNTYIVYKQKDIETQADEYGIFHTETAETQTFDSAHSLKLHLEKKVSVKLCLQVRKND